MVALEGRTVLLSGARSGVGPAISAALARLGANVVLFMRGNDFTTEVSARGREAGRAVRDAGGSVLAIEADLRSPDDVARVADAAHDRFGSIDAVVNNAGVLGLHGTEALPLERLDMMLQVNLRGTYLMTRAALPALREAENSHILTVSPPLNMSEHWLGAHPAYTVSKYGMTLMTLGWAAEFADDDIAANSLWPQTALVPRPRASEVQSWTTRSARSPEIMADAAVEVLSRPSSLVTGRTLLDVEVLESAGVTDLWKYGGGDHPERDLFVDATN